MCLSFRLQYLCLLSGDGSRDVARRIVEIAKNPCLPGTRLDAERLLPLVHTMSAEGALLDHTGLGIVLRNFIRAGRDTILTGRTVLCIDQHNSVGPSGDGHGGTHSLAGRALAVHARCGKPVHREVRVRAAWGIY